MWILVRALSELALVVSAGCFGYALARLRDAKKAERAAWAELERVCAEVGIDPAQAIAIAEQRERAIWN